MEHIKRYLRDVRNGAARDRRADREDQGHKADDRFRPLIVFAVIAVLVWACIAPAIGAELLKIRVHNQTGGLIQVCVDGVHYSTVGRVLRPAITSLEGFSAADFIQSARVAATAVHGIRIKTGDTPKSLMISLVPYEFASTPKGFGGHIPYDSGIYTDIPAGKGIFRNLAPYVGNPVYIQQDGKHKPLPAGYKPSIGDVLIISVSRPERWIREISFENKAGGRVTATYTDGKTEEITRVEKPVEGVGRFDGTSYTGRGRINTNHPGVLTISTAPVSTAALEGVGDERRGGFQIIPSYHARSLPTPLYQAMIVGPVKPKAPDVEGKAPLFSGFVGLAWDTANDKHSYRVQVRIDGGDWENVPEIVGKVDNAFTAEGISDYFKNRGIDRKVLKGITHVRILFPQDDREFVLAEAAKTADAYLAAAGQTNGGGLKVVSGTYDVRAPMTDLPSGTIVTFFVDGRAAKISAASPHDYEWNTKLVSDGEHVIDIRATNTEGLIIKTITVKYFVKNK